MANGNSYLAQQRAPLFDELAQKPWLMNWLASIGESENSGKPLGILEALFNRAAWSGKSLESLVKSGFYGPRTVARLRSDTSGAGTLSPKAAANAQNALAQIKAGSNVTQGSVDQGQVNEIKGPFKINVDGEYYGDMGNSAAWRAQQQAAAAKAGPVAGTQVASNAPTAPAPTAATAPSTPSPSSTAATSSSTGTGAPGLYARGGTLPSGLPGRSLAGVSPVLQELLGGAKAEFERANPGYTIVATSGARPGGPSSSQHAGGNAIDMQIVGPNGQAIANTGNDPSGLYHQYARYVYAEQQANHPELNGKLAWGGAFGTQLGGGGPPDLMHFDLGGERGHWTMNRPSQLGGLPLQLANAATGTTGATNVADNQTQPSGSGLVDRPTGPLGSGPGTPGWNRALGVPQARGPKGKGGMAGPTAMSQQGGAPYIPILSEIGAMFGGGYPGRPGLKGGYMQPAQATQADQPWVAPVAAAAAKAASTPSNVTPATGDTGPTPIKPISVTDYLNPSASTNPPVTPTPGPGPSRPNMPMPGSPGVPLPSPQVAGGPMPGAPNIPGMPPGTQLPGGPGAQAGLTPRAPYDNWQPGKSPVPLAPWPTSTTPPTANTPQARIPGILPGASAPLPRSILSYLNPVSSANAAELPPGPSATAAVQGASAVGLPQGASFAERFAGAPGGPGTGQYSNPALAAALGISPQPSFPGGQVPMPRANPIAGTQTALAIPPRGPWPPAPPTPQQASGMTIAGIPLPRPRPQMPANPPQQIPQPGSVPAPQNFPPSNVPSGPPADVSRATFAERFAGEPVRTGIGPMGGIARTNATPGSLGGTEMPRGARPGVRFLDTIPAPQSTSQGGPVPPPTPSQTVSPAQLLADQVTNSPATGMVPTSSGDAGAHAVTPFPLARPPVTVPNASFADRFQASQPAQGQDDMNAALLEYLRRQAQQTPDYGADYGSYAGAY